jgi:hypothetical protein
MERASLAAALNESEDGVLVPAARTDFETLFAADIGFVDFDDAASAAHGGKRTVAHSLSNSVAEKPSGFHAARKHSLDLIGRDTFLASAHKMDNLKPEMQRQMRRLEDSSLSHGEWLAAFPAIVKTFAGSFAGRLGNALGIAIAAVRASRPVRPKQRLDVRKGGVFVLEAVFGKNGMGHGVISYGLVPTMDFILCQV